MVAAGSRPLRSPNQFLGATTHPCLLLWVPAQRGSTPPPVCCAQVSLLLCCPGHFWAPQSTFERSFSHRPFSFALSLSSRSLICAPVDLLSILGPMAFARPQAPCQLSAPHVWGPCALSTVSGCLWYSTPAQMIGRLTHPTPGAARVPSWHSARLTTVPHSTLTMRARDHGKKGR